MNVTFIHHSSFLVEEASVFLLFDYTEGQIPLLPKDAPLYVLASHSHGDHFSPAIFALAKEHPNVRFVLSRTFWMLCRRNCAGINRTLRLLCRRICIWINRTS